MYSISTFEYAYTILCQNKRCLAQRTSVLSPTPCQGYIYKDAWAIRYSHCSSRVSMSSSRVSSTTTRITHATSKQLKPALSKHTCQRAALLPQHGFSQLDLRNKKRMRGRERERNVTHHIFFNLCRLLHCNLSESYFHLHANDVRAKRANGVQK